MHTHTHTRVINWQQESEKSGCEPNFQLAKKRNAEQFGEFNFR